MTDEERRCTARYEPARATVKIRWSGPGGFECIEAEVLNIGLGGLAVTGERLPEEGCTAWVRPACPSREEFEWVSACVEEVCSGSGVEQRARLKFNAFCPYDFFRTIIISVTDGVDDPSVAPPPGEESSHEPAALERGAYGEDPFPDSRLEAQLEKVLETSAVPTSNLKTALAARTRLCGGPNISRA